MVPIVFVDCRDAYPVAAAPRCLEAKSLHEAGEIDHTTIADINLTT